MAKLVSQVYAEALFGLGVENVCWIRFWRS